MGYVYNFPLIEYTVHIKRRPLKFKLAVPIQCLEYTFRGIFISYMPRMKGIRGKIILRDISSRKVILSRILRDAGF